MRLALIPAVALAAAAGGPVCGRTFRAVDEAAVLAHLRVRVGEARDHVEAAVGLRAEGGLRVQRVAGVPANKSKRSRPSPRLVM